MDVRDACSASGEAQHEIVAFLKKADDSVSILFSETTSPAVTKNPLFAYLKKHAERSEAFDTFSPAEAGRFFLSEVRSRSKAVTVRPDAVSKAVSSCKGDSAGLASLAETLVAFRGEDGISVADVELFVSEDPKEAVFDALDALLAGDRPRAMSVLLRASRRDAGGAVKIFGLLAWQMRVLFGVRGECDRGNFRADDIARATGMKPYAAGKLVPKMDVFPLSRLKSGLALLADLDAGMKTGRIGDEAALVAFVGKL